MPAISGDVSRLWLVCVLLTIPLAFASGAGAPPSEEQLARLSTKELVHRYVRAPNSACMTCANDIEKVLRDRDPNEIFQAIVALIDRYDPRTFRGRWPPSKVGDAYWALALLSAVDQHQIRARGCEEGRRALEAFDRMLQRKKEAGHDSDKVYAWQARYKAEVSQYRDMNGVNGQDRRISLQLKEDYGIQLSETELHRFSDFLVAKDPRYVAWSKSDYVGSARHYRFLNMQPYYAAYQEFKRAESEAGGTTDDGVP